MIDFLLNIVCIIVVLVGGWGISCEYRAIKQAMSEDNENIDTIE